MPDALLPVHAERPAVCQIRLVWCPILMELFQGLQLRLVGAVRCLMVMPPVEWNGMPVETNELVCIGSLRGMERAQQEATGACGHVHISKTVCRRLAHAWLPAWLHGWSKIVIFNHILRPVTHAKRHVG